MYVGQKVFVFLIGSTNQTFYFGRFTKCYHSNCIEIGSKPCEETGRMFWVFPFDIRHQTGYSATRHFDLIFTFIYRAGNINSFCCKKLTIFFCQSSPLRGNQKKIILNKTFILTKASWPQFCVETIKRKYIQLRA